LRFIPQFGRAVHHNPSQLHLGQGADLRESAEREGERNGILRKGDRSLPLPAKAIVGEDLIGDDGRVVLATDLGHLVQFELPDIGPRGIVGMNHQHGARA